jgi:hypothetical protein
MPIFAMIQMDARISELVARLTVLERERAEIVAEIDALRSAHDAGTGAVKVVPSGRADDPTDRNSPIEKKIALFRRLFRGRSDVFPIRWENRTTGRSGYAPACGNEWQPGICGKPKVKCSACPNQAFLAQRRDIATRIAAIPQAEERVIVATGRYLGEGFDDSRLDTLFLTMPIAWKGTLAQYAGRLHRLNDAKREVITYDYADMRVPVLARMAAKRRIGYQAIGYKVLGTRDLFSERAVTPNEPT